jgi:glycosyltransferase involved in cell wall biosynthesis
MKIAYFIDNLRGDGTQHALTQLVQGLAKRGHSQKVLCLNDSYDVVIVNELRSTTVEDRIVGKTALASGYGLMSVTTWLERERFDAVVTMLFAADVIGRLLARWNGVPRIISSLRARNVHYSWLQRWLVRATINLADTIIINTAHARDFAVREEGVSPDRIRVIPNGVSVEIFSNPISQTLLREKLSLPKTGWLLGTVGRLTKQKGIDILLHALSLTSNRDFNLVIFGTGGDEARLRALAVKLGLESYVHFAGYRRDLPTLLGALDLYVHPARFEGMPNAMLEAMAAACPIIATAVDGNRELIDDGKHGWLISSESPKELAKAIDKALSNPKEARRRGALAHERAREEFSINSMVAAWEAVLVTEKSASIRKESSYRYAR